MSIDGVVRSNRPRLVRAWLRGRSHVMQGMPEAVFSLSGAHVLVTVPGVVDDAAQLVGLAAGHGGFCLGGSDLRGRWRESAAHLGATVGECFSFELSGPFGLVRFAAAADRESLDVTLERANGARVTTTLDDIEPDLARWRATVDQLVLDAQDMPAPGPFR